MILNKRKLGNNRSKVTDELLLAEYNEKQAQIQKDRLDMTFGEIISMYERSELNISPDYQRNYRWTNEQKTAYIESIILGIPTPSIFVTEDVNGHWELIDGLQRVSTVISFFGKLRGDNVQNHWMLGRGGILSGLEGFVANELPMKMYFGILRSVCRIEIIRIHSMPDIRYELFKRLNSGGTLMTPQEIRNAIYRGGDAEPFIQMIAQLSQSPDFQSLLGVKNKKRLVLFDQELVLRYFWIAHVTQMAANKDNLQSSLNRFLQEVGLNPKRFPIVQLEDQFLGHMRWLVQHDGYSLLLDKNRILSPTHFETVSYCLQRFYHPATTNELRFLEKLRQILVDSDYRDVSVRTRSHERVSKRLQWIEEYFRKNPL
jgi:hypothetical protein